MKAFILTVHAIAALTVAYVALLLADWILGLLAPYFAGQRWFDGLSALIGMPIVPSLTPYVFSWWGLAAAAAFTLVSGLGITVGFHRFLTHAGFETYTWVKYLLVSAGLSALEGSAPRWVATHRIHHQHSDEEGDPHSPEEGWWWAHMGWLFVLFTTDEIEQEIRDYAPDLMKDPFIRFTHRHYWLVPLLMAAALAAAGYACDGWAGVSSFLLLAFFVRIVLVWNVTWCVNSVTHMWGYRNYETSDKSKNNWIIGILAYGEGWHNNHHKYPRLAMHGHKPWEIDTSYMLIRILRLLRLAWNVKDTIPRQSTA